MMPSSNIAFTYCLFAGLYITSVSGQGPALRIRAIPGGVINTGGSVTLECEADRDDLRICLVKEGSRTPDCKDVKGKVAIYTINITTYSDGGTFHCSCPGPSTQYPQCSSSQALTIQVIVSGQRPALRIRAIPGGVINTGGSVTLQCEADRDGLRICLLKVESNTGDCKDGTGKVATYTINITTYSDGGRYYCFCPDPNTQYPTCSSSQALTIHIIDIKKPNISWERNPADKTNIIINCTAPVQSWQYKVRFILLNSVGIMENDSQRNPLSSTFSVPHDGVSKYRCSYVVEIPEDPKYPKYPKYDLQSPESDPVLPLPTDPDTEYITTGLAIAAVVVLICIAIVAFLLIRKRKNSRNKNNDSALPLDDKSADVPEPLYCSAEENVNKGNSNIKQKPDDTAIDDCGITYAVLNQTALEKRNTLKDVPEDVTVYAQVKPGNDN